MAALICCWLWLDQQWIKVVDENGWVCVCVNLLWLNDANVHCGPIQLIHIIILWCNFTLFFFSIPFPFPVLLPPLLLSVLCAKTHPHTHISNEKKPDFITTKLRENPTVITTQSTWLQSGDVDWCFVQLFRHYLDTAGICAMEVSVVIKVAYIFCVPLLLLFAEHFLVLCYTWP